MGSCLSCCCPSRERRYGRYGSDDDRYGGYGDPNMGTRRDEDLRGYDDVFPDALGSQAQSRRPLAGQLQNPGSYDPVQTRSPRGGRDRYRDGRAQSFDSDRSWGSRSSYDSQSGDGRGRGTSHMITGLPSVLLGAGLCLFATLALAALIAAIYALVQQSVKTFSNLAARNGFASGWALLLVVAILLGGLLLAACCGVGLPCVPPQEAREASTGWIVCVSVLALAIFVLALVGMIVTHLSYDSVARSANEICAAYDKGGIPQCSTGGRLLSAWEVEAREGEEHRFPAVRWLSSPPLGVNASGGSDIPQAEQRAVRRRLDDAHGAAQGYIASTSGSEECATTKDLCVAQSGWNAKTSCACSGASLATGGAQQGSYCNDWSNDGNSWCFVDASVQCGPPTDFSGLKRSTGPCGSSVDSRSQMVLDARTALLVPFILALITSVLVCFAACCGCYFCLNALKGNRLNSARGYPGGGGSYENEPSSLTRAMKTQQVNNNDISHMNLDEQFRWAQEQASKNLTDHTPQEKKLELYGYYHQAVQGNVTGERPSMWHFLDQHKYDAWKRVEGMPRNDAMRRYIEAVQRLPPAPGVIQDPGWDPVRAKLPSTMAAQGAPKSGW